MRVRLRECVCGNVLGVNCVWSCMYIGMPEACCVCALQCMRMTWAKTEFKVEQYELQCVGGVMNGDVGHAWVRTKVLEMWGGRPVSCAWLAQIKRRPNHPTRSVQLLPIPRASRSCHPEHGHATQAHTQTTPRTSVQASNFTES